jgi:hypothetical protein
MGQQWPDSPSATEKISASRDPLRKIAELMLEKGATVK